MSLEEGETVFFYIDSFESGDSSGIPPIPGEIVSVEIYPVSDKKLRRAKKVLRMETPQLCQGVIRKFNPKRGFGFIRWKKGECFFHRSDADGFFPCIGEEVSFFLGRRETNYRACYLKKLAT